MRKPDFAAIRYALDRGERVHIRLLLNVVCYCGLVPVRAEPDALKLMAMLIEQMGPQVRLQQGARNLAIARKLRSVDTFHTTLVAERESIAHSEHISANRVAKIQRGQYANPALAAFVLSVRRGRPPKETELDAAKHAMKEMVSRLMTRSGPAEALRARLCTDYREVRTSAFQEELVDDVHNLVSEGMSVRDAIQTVADAHGQASAVLKSAYFRHQRKTLRNLDDVVGVANQGNLILEEPSGAVLGLAAPTIHRQDVEERHTHGLDGFR